MIAAAVSVMVCLVTASTPVENGLAFAQSTLPPGYHPLDVKKELKDNICAVASGTVTCVYTVTVTNPSSFNTAFSGPVTLADQLYPYVQTTVVSATGGWTCSGGSPAGTPVLCSQAALSLAIGASTSFELTLSYPEAAAPAGDFNCVKYVAPASAGTDCAPVRTAKNEDLTPYDISTFKTVVGNGPDTKVGDPFSFEIVVRNNAGAVPIASGTEITVVDEIPAGFTLQSVDLNGWTCAPTSGVGPLTLVCKYTLTSIFPPSNTGNSDLPKIVLHGFANKVGAFANCATGFIVGQHETTPEVNRHCVAAGALLERDGPGAESDCLELKPQLSVNGDGTATLTMSGSAPAAGGSSQLVSVHPQTTGVGVTPASQSFAPGAFTGNWTLTGVSPGQKIKIRIDAVQIGTGRGGMDTCCSATIEVTVPSDKIDVKIEKTGGRDQNDQGKFVYTLIASNVGATISPTNTIVVTDTVPAQSYLFITSVTAPDWDCGTNFPINPGQTLTCTYIGMASFGPGDALPPIIVHAISPVPIEPINCAVVSLSAASGLVDSNPANDKDCIGGQSGQATLTVTKVVDTDSIDYSMITFQVAVSCQPPTGSAVTSTLALNQTVSYQQTTANMPVGSVCTINELPASSPPGFPPNCQWQPSYPNGQQITLQAGNNTLQVTNEQNCTTLPDPGEANVRITKTPVIDGQVTFTPGVGFPINASCTEPDGTVTDMTYTATAGWTFSTSTFSVPLNTTCTVNEPPPPLPPGRENCRWLTTYLFNGTPVTSFPVTITTAVSPSNVFEVKNVLDCSTPAPLTTACPKGERLVDGKCRPACRAPEHWNGRRCVRCDAGEKWDEGRRACRPACAYPELWNGRSCVRCSADEIWNAARKACERRETPATTACPDGERTSDGKCQALCSYPEHWNGRKCVRCASDERWDQRTRKCLFTEPGASGAPAPAKPTAPAEPATSACDPSTTKATDRGCACRYLLMQQVTPTRCACPARTALVPGIGCVLACEPPMTPNLLGTKCECPKGTKLEDGECVKDDEPDIKFDFGIPVRPSSRPPTDPSPPPRPRRP
jgi:hypothetical protein